MDLLKMFKGRVNVSSSGYLHKNTPENVLNGNGYWATNRNYTYPGSDANAYMGSTRTLDIGGEFIDIAFPEPVFLEKIAIRAEDNAYLPGTMSLFGMDDTSQWTYLRSIAVGETILYAMKRYTRYRIVITDVFQGDYARIDKIDMAGRTSIVSDVTGDNHAEHFTTMTAQYPSWIIPAALGALFAWSASRVAMRR